MKRMHPWDSPEPEDRAPVARGASVHSWGRESDPEEDGGDDASSASSDMQEGEESAGQKLVDFLMDLHLARSLSARDFCIAMHWAKESGVAEAAPYAFRPGAPTGHYQRHLTVAMPFLRDREDLYTITIPTFENAQRTTRDLHMLLPHECLQEELEQDDTMVQKLRRLKEARALPRAYTGHPVVEAAGAGESVIPLSFYIDGVAYSNNDTVIGYWLTNEVSERRHLLCALRNKLLCQCGCRGWCTHFQVFSALHWSLKALADGAFPTARHFGTEWSDGDCRRAGKAGLPLAAKACVIFIKGDWSEYAGTIGVPNWNDGLRPCYSCNCHTGNMYSDTGLSMLSSPWRASQQIDYYDACEQCETEIELTEEDHRLLCGLLQPDMRAAGSHGLALTMAIPHLGLRAGDRLEPCAHLPDVGKFRSASTFPLKLMFWRTSAETMTRHRNPLLDPAIGITMNSLTVDTLHTLCLGIVHEWVSATVWDLVDSKVYCSRSTAEETMETSARLIDHELKAFYSAHRSTTGRPLTTVTMSKQMLNQKARKLKTKGAQTWGVCLYLVQKLEKAGSIVPGSRRKIAAGQAICELVKHWDGCGAVMTAAECQISLDLWKRHLLYTKDDDRVKVPKRHLVYHLISKIPYFGNPRTYACWRDEGLNRELKRSCRTTSQQTFEVLLLLRFRQRLRRGLV